MYRRGQGIYKPADLTYFINELRRASRRGSRANFWHVLRLYLQQRPKRS